ncbi:MAG: hypothetical protein JWP25_5131 [Bradyrhizobium sp.]|nr:hypothetical protein [Bradyrhizobium sp.]
MNRASMRIWGLTASRMNQLSRIGVKPDRAAKQHRDRDGWRQRRQHVARIRRRDHGLVAGLVERARGKPERHRLHGCAGSNKADRAIELSGLNRRRRHHEGPRRQDGLHAGKQRRESDAVEPVSAGHCKNAGTRGSGRGIFVAFDDDNGVMAILPKQGARNGTAPTLDPTNGTLIGYPSYIGPGQIGLECLYNPAIRWMGNVNVQNSFVSGANGTWRVNNLTHNLESQIPDGAWFSEITAQNLTTSSRPDHFMIAALIRFGRKAYQSAKVHDMGRRKPLLALCRKSSCPMQSGLGR